MPSICCVCKKVKQIGDIVSFHKFPFHNKEICSKWVEFVNKNAPKDSTNAGRKITKFSSICSQHFDQADILENGLNSRRSLKRHAVPSFKTQQVPIQEIITVDEAQTENYEFCGLCRTLSREKSLILIDDNNFSIMRKCLPFVNFNLSLMQKICCECTEILNTFSSFIDRVVVAQNMLNQEVSIRRMDEISRSTIKLEPLTTEDERPKLTPKNFEQHLAPKPSNRNSTSQKKCEILEIVDIKPFNFLPFETNALTCEPSDQNVVTETNYEEDEIQILSPNQLKVEINDQDDGENELELIKNYVYISTIFMHDHNYVKEMNNGSNVKTEFDEDIQIQSRSLTPLSVQEVIPVKICCHKRFTSYKEYFLHKIVKHQSKESPKIHCAVCKKKFTSEKSLQYHKRLLCKTNSQQMKKVKENYYKILMGLKEKRRNQRQRKPRKTSFVCKICNKIFKGSKNLYQHKNATHRTLKHSCYICHKTFKMKHGLKQHIKAQHEKQKLYRCAICNHSFALKGDLKRCRHSDLKRKT